MRNIIPVFNDGKSVLSSELNEKNLHGKIIVFKHGDLSLWFLKRKGDKFVFAKVTSPYEITADPMEFDTITQAVFHMNHVQFKKCYLLDSIEYIGKVYNM